MPAASSTLTGTCTFQSKKSKNIITLLASLFPITAPPSLPPSSVCVQHSEDLSLVQVGVALPPPKNRKLRKWASDEAHTECKVLQLSEDSSVSCMNSETTHPPEPIINISAKQTDSCCYGDAFKNWTEKQSNTCHGSCEVFLQQNYDWYVSSLHSKSIRNIWMFDRMWLCRCRKEECLQIRKSTNVTFKVTIWCILVFDF